MKASRGKSTQQKQALEMSVARETISRYETGKDRVNIDVARHYSKKYDNPSFAITVQHEYTGTGPILLDGPNADLHRSAVKEKTLEEMEEALNGLKNTSFVKPMGSLQLFEIQEVQKVLEELIEANTAISNLIATICVESKLSYRSLWADHYQFLIAEGYLLKD